MSYAFNKGFIDLNNSSDIGEGIRCVMILEEAEEYEIKWDTTVYEPILLKVLINRHLEKEKE
jgi:hypothetical protein